MIDKIHCQFKVGNDIHKPLIAMFQAIQNGWDFPMHISEEEYIHVRDNKTKFSSYDAYSSILCSPTLQIIFSEFKATSTFAFICSK